MNKWRLVEFLHAAIKAVPQDDAINPLAAKLGLVHSKSFSASITELIELLNDASVQFGKKRTEQELATLLDGVVRKRYEKSAAKCVKVMGGFETAQKVAEVCKRAIEFNKQVETGGVAHEGVVSGITLSRFAEEIAQERVDEVVDELVQSALTGKYGSGMDALAKIVDGLCNFVGTAVTFEIPEGLDPAVMALCPPVDFMRMGVKAMNFSCSPSDCCRNLKPFNDEPVRSVIFLDPPVFDILMKSNTLELFGNYAARRTFGVIVPDTTMALYLVLYANLSTKMARGTIFEWERPILVQLLPCVDKLIGKWFKGCALQPNGLYLPTEQRKVCEAGKPPPRSTAVLEFTPGIHESRLDAYLEGGVAYLQCLVTLPKLDLPLQGTLRMLLRLLVKKPWREIGFFKRFTSADLGVRTAEELDESVEFCSLPPKQLAPEFEKDIMQLWYGPVSAILGIRQGAIPSADFVENPEYRLATLGVSPMDIIMAVISDIKTDVEIAGFAQTEKDRLERLAYCTKLYDKGVKDTMHYFVAKIVPMDKPTLKEFLADFKPRKAPMDEFLAEPDPEKRILMVPMHIKNVLRYINQGGRFPGVILFEAKGLGGVVQELNSINVQGGRTLYQFLEEQFKNAPMLLNKLKKANFCVATKRDKKRDDGVPYTISTPQPIPSAKIVDFEEKEELAIGIGAENADIYADTCRVLLELEERITVLDPTLEAKLHSRFSVQLFDFPFFTKGHAAAFVKEAEEADFLLKKLKASSLPEAEVFASEIVTRVHNKKSLTKVIDRSEARIKFFGLRL